jgi:hypothetical protein
LGGGIRANSLALRHFLVTLVGSLQQGDFRTLFLVYELHVLAL